LVWTCRNDAEGAEILRVGDDGTEAVVAGAGAGNGAAVGAASRGSRISTGSFFFVCRGSLIIIFFFFFFFNLFFFFFLELRFFILLF
jgi:hypothetical protein